MESGQEQLADVIPIQRHTERINGVRLHLGAMSVDELAGVREHCVTRFEAAERDLEVVDGYMTRHGLTPLSFGGEPEPAA